MLTLFVGGILGNPGATVVFLWDTNSIFNQQIQLGREFAVG